MISEYPMVTAPLGPARRPDAGKADLLARARQVIAQLRSIAIATRGMGYDVADLERDISRAELEAANAIDEFMAARYRSHEIEVRRLHGLEARR